MCIPLLEKSTAHRIGETSDRGEGEEGRVVAEALWTSLFLTVYTEIRAIAIARSSGTQHLE